MNSHRLSDAANRIKSSPTIALATRARELRAAGRDVISLTAGEPDFDTPAHIKQAAIDAIHAGHTKYTAPDGTPELKQAIRAKFERDNGLSYDSGQIIVSVGAKHAIFNLFMAVLNPQDEVIVPAPYWVSYPDMVALAGAVPVIVPAGIEQSFKLTAAQLQQAISPRTRLVLLNSPCNPSGAIYTRAELEQIADILAAYPHILILSDDIYEHIVWGEPFVNIVNVCAALAERTVVVNGVSKAYAMTGWRIGYAAGPASVIGAMKKIQSQSTSNPSSVGQAAALAALNGDQRCVADMVRSYQERHAVIVARLNSLRGVRCRASDGTFYVFPDVREVPTDRSEPGDDAALAEYLLDRADVAVVPGSAFGMPGYLRLSFATDLAALQQALERMGRLVGSDAVADGRRG